MSDVRGAQSEPNCPFKDKHQGEINSTAEAKPQTTLVNRVTFRTEKISWSQVDVPDMRKSVIAFAVLGGIVFLYFFGTHLSVLKVLIESLILPD